MKSDILNIGRLQLYSVWEQFHDEDFLNRPTE